MRVILLPILLATAAVVALPNAPALAQDATSCGNEAQRLSSGIPLSTPSAIMPGQPGTRVDAGMTGDQQNQARTLMDQARLSARQGDGAGCMSSLSQARGLLRQGGVGTPPSGGTVVPSADQRTSAGTPPDSAAEEPDPANAGPRGTTPGAGSSARSTTPGTASQAIDSMTPGTRDGTAAPQGAESPRTVPPPLRSRRESATLGGGGDGAGSGSATSSTSGGSTGSTSGGASSATSGGTGSGGAASSSRSSGSARPGSSSGGGSGGRSGGGGGR